MSGKKLGRNTSHRKAMMRNMVTSLFDHEKIRTTDVRAKELRKMAEKLITLAKRGDLHARRQAMQVIRDSKVVAKLFERIAVRYQERQGGYTRIIKLGHRSGDNASMSLIELVEEELAAKPKKSKPVKAAAPAPVEKPVAVETAQESVEETSASPEEKVPEEAAVSAEETSEKGDKKE
jgi:large subunit ribosomal protein L17